MGTTDFLKHTFFKPKVIALQNGKFALRQYGNLLLAVGTDRNISDSLIESRANLLTNLINLYHCNLLRVSKAEESENELKSRKRLSEKLYQILETFLPILQYNNNGNVFQNQPKLRISKSSAGNIFLDAIETLQSCQQYKGNNNFDFYINIYHQTFNFRSPWWYNSLPQQSCCNSIIRDHYQKSCPHRSFKD